MLSTPGNFIVTMIGFIISFLKALEQNGNTKLLYFNLSIHSHFMKDILEVIKLLHSIDE